MFGPPGIAYVYFTYGMHHCMNAVTGPEGSASAVLIRALRPCAGVEEMREGAPATLRDHLLASGPGRVCRALGVDRSLNGTTLDGPGLAIYPRTQDPGEVLTSVRIGLTRDDGREWRFFLDDPSVSRSRRRGNGS